MHDLSPSLQVPKGTAFVEVTGSLLFGAGDMLERVSSLQATAVAAAAAAA